MKRQQGHTSRCIPHCTALWTAKPSHGFIHRTAGSSLLLGIDLLDHAARAATVCLHNIVKKTVADMCCTYADMTRKMWLAFVQIGGPGRTPCVIEEVVELRSKACCSTLISLIKQRKIGHEHLEITMHGSPARLSKSRRHAPPQYCSQASTCHPSASLCLYPLCHKRHKFVLHTSPNLYQNLYSHHA